MAQNTFPAWSCGGAKEPLKVTNVELFMDLEPDFVEVRVSHCGVCHTDASLIDNEWGLSSYPLVCGHETVGLVSARGSNVTSVKVGDRVGCSNQSSACLQCDACMSGRENLCSKAEWLVNQGGFGEFVRLHHTFVYALPASLASEHAAPLMCAGASVYPCFKLNGVRSGQRVGVVGIGGLGHLALQFARAWGVHVTALSSTPDKDVEARRFGAHDFACTTDRAALLKSHTHYFDFLLVTVSQTLDWSTYLALVRNGGTICCVGIPGLSVTLPSSFDFITRELHFVGSGGCSRTNYREMIAFAALHNIRPQVELMPFEGINEALDRVRKNQARYRIVLKK